MIDPRIFYTLYVIGILAYMATLLFIGRANFEKVFAASVGFLVLVGAVHALTLIWS